MPHYYPEDSSGDNIKKLIRQNVCQECGRQLYAYLDGEGKTYIACGGGQHEGIKSLKPEDLKQLRRTISMDSTALTKLGNEGMLARIEQARFPQALKPEEKAMIAEVALSYGLDPIMNELTIYQGRPYPTVNAWYRKSQESGQFDGMNSRPATKEEREDRNTEEGDLLYRCEVYRKGGSHPFVGWGKVFAAERKGNEHLPIVKWSDRMCEKRAEMQAMRKAFSIPMPSMSYEEIPGTGKVNTTTGEIIEGEVTELTPTPEPQPEATEPTPPPTKVGGDSESPIDMPWLIESVNTLKWDILQYMKDTYKVDTSGNLGDVVGRLTNKQQQAVCKEVQERLDMK